MQNLLITPFKKLIDSSVIRSGIYDAYCTFTIRNYRKLTLYVWAIDGVDFHYDELHTERKILLKINKK